MVHLSPMKLWKLMGPLEVSASKSGAVEPRRRLIAVSIWESEYRAQYWDLRRSAFSHCVDEKEIIGKKKELRRRTGSNTKGQQPLQCIQVIGS